jgi:hypothetical protein
MVTSVLNPDGSITQTDQDGNKLYWRTVPTSNPALVDTAISIDGTNWTTIFTGGLIGGDRAQGRFIANPDNPNILTDPATGFIRWAG